VTAPPEAARPPVFPPARIRRDTGSQRRFLAEATERAATLARFAAMSAGGARNAALAARLAPLRTALLASPFWRSSLLAQGLAPDDLASVDALRHFPTLDRTALARGWHDIVVLPEATRDQDEIVAVRSSGTTGDPVLVPKDRYDCLHMWSVLRFWTAWLRIPLPPRPRVVLLCSLPSALEYSVRLPLFHDGALHRISLLRPRALERLRRAAPAVVFSDPEGLHWLAAQSGPRAPALLLSSATHMPALLRQGFAAPLLNYYATTETGPIAWECLVRGDRFHVLLPDVWVESVAGSLLVTRLRPSVLPLLRYHTGDSGSVVDEDCPCGYHGTSITGFRGRSACDFRLRSGARVDAWRLAWLVKHHPLRAFRLTQQAAEHFVLELVAAPDPTRLSEPMLAALQALGWESPRLDIRVVESLPETPKPEPFRCAWLGPGE